MGGKVRHKKFPRLEVHPLCGYCGARYFKPSDRDDENVIKFTIQQKKDINPGEPSGGSGGLGIWYRFIPFHIIQVIPSIPSLVVSTAIRWLPRLWFGTRRES